MALIKCTGCGHQISSKAKSCPKCGYVTREDRSAGDAGAGAESPPEQAAPAADAAALDPGPSAALPQDARQESAQEWYYVSSSGRSGPVTLASLQMLAADGQIDRGASVWKAGMPDWIALSRLGEAAESPMPAEPPPVAETSPGKASGWALALAPLWGTLLQILATELWVVASNQPLGYYSQLWWIMIAANLGAACFDAGKPRKSGPDLLSNKWIFLLVPAYLYLRERTAAPPLMRFWAWIGSLLASLAAYHYLNGIYARLSIG